jgi:cell division septation protein DedD
MAMGAGRDPDEREILDLIPERFDSDLDSAKSRRSTWTRLVLSIALALLAIAALGVAARHVFFGDSEIIGQQSQIPVVAPDTAPIKNRPEDQGGMAVPNQDKLVYNAFRGGANSAAPPEQLLPAPEEPKAPPVASIKPAFPPAAPAADAPSPAPAPAPATAASPPAAATNSPAVVSAAAPAPAPAATPATPAAGGKWLVQIGALRSENDAKAEWNRVQSADKDLVSGLSSDIQKADLGARGIFWRLRAGPLDEAAARTLCAQFIKHGRGCLVVRK